MPGPAESLRQRGVAEQMAGSARIDVRYIAQGTR
jgi:hypothetical protein